MSVDGAAPGALVGTPRRIAYAGQGSPILAGTLRRALTLGCARRPPDTEVERVARVFGLGAVLDRLGGLDGRVGEGGRTLSSGEARRLLLARTALSGAGLILLDEPDDVLDAAAGGLLDGLMRETAATLVVATHDPRIAALMDEAWVLEDGRIVRRGPAHEVVERRARDPRQSAA